MSSMYMNTSTICICIHQSIYIYIYISERLLLRGLTFSKDLAQIKGMLVPLENNFKGVYKTR